jgi:hypothetical protein
VPQRALAHNLRRDRVAGIAMMMNDDALVEIDDEVMANARDPGQSRPAL